MRINEVLVYPHFRKGIRSRCQVVAEHPRVVVTFKLLFTINLYNVLLLLNSIVTIKTQDKFQTFHLNCKIMITLPDVIFMRLLTFCK